MTAPLIHIFSARVQEGRLEGYKGYAREHAAFVEAKHPGLLAFHLYLSADGREVSAVQVHPDADSMDFFMKEVVAEHGVKAYEFLERGSERSDAWGTLNETIQEQIRQFGVELNVRPHHLAGFTRSAASGARAAVR